jgi:hypothetical protein
MSPEQKHIERGFSVIRLMLDDQGIRTLPVGVAAWDEERDWHQVRVLQDEESIRGLPKHLRLLIETVVQNLSRWAVARNVGSHKDLKPTNSLFWEAARNRLLSAVRLDPPKALEPTPHPEMGIDTLFDAVVQPHRKLGVEYKRIDGAISKALGTLTNKLQGRTEVRAYHDATESVLRAAKSDSGMVVVEGVNLAGSTARKDADALVSRLLRIRAGSENESTTFIIGYLASPGGLNGEGHMREWMKDQVTSDVFDLNKEREQFRNRTHALLEEAGITLRLL